MINLTSQVPVSSSLKRRDRMITTDTHKQNTEIITNNECACSA